MAGIKGCNTGRWSYSQNPGLSSGWSLQLDCMKVESLVIADHHAAVNAFPRLEPTARQAVKAGGTRSRSSQPAREGRAEGKLGDWR